MMPRYFLSISAAAASISFLHFFSSAEQSGSISVCTKAKRSPNRNCEKRKPLGRFPSASYCGSIEEIPIESLVYLRRYTSYLVFDFAPFPIVSSNISCLFFSIATHINGNSSEPATSLDNTICSPRENSSCPSRRMECHESSFFLYNDLETINAGFTLTSVMASHFAD